MIAAEHIYYSVAGHSILEDISFSTRPGEIVTVVGPNGCGKSTLLKILSRLLKADQGTVCFRGKPLSSYPGKELAGGWRSCPRASRSRRTPPWSSWSSSGVIPTRASAAR